METNSQLLAAAYLFNAQNTHQRPGQRRGQAFSCKDPGGKYFRFLQDGSSSCHVVLKQQTIKKFFFFAIQCSTCSLTRDQTFSPAMEAQNPNRWNTGEVPRLFF